MARSARLALPGLLIALVAGLLFVLFSTGDEPRGMRDGQVPAEAEGSESEAPAVLPAARAEVPRARTEVSPRAPTEREEGAAPVETAVLADEAQLREVEVVEAGSGRPLPEAEAWFLAGFGEWSPLSFDGLLARGTPVRADAQGIVRFAWPAGGEVLVLARAGARCGGGTIGERVPLAPRARIELYPDWEVDIEVLYADGSPAPEVPIRCGFFEGGSLDLGLRVTAKDGHARVGHVGLGFALSAAAHLELRVDLPLAEPLSRRVPRGPAPAEPIRFRLPAGGTLEVALVDLERRPVRETCEVKLGLIWPGEARELSAFRSVERTTIERTTSDGRSVFPFVALGAELELRVRRAGSRAELREYLPGPRSAGERLEHTLQLGSQHPLLEFRALDPAGAPLVETELALELFAASENISGTENPLATTDGSGRFRVEIGHTFRNGDHVRLLVQANEGDLSALCDLSRPFEPGLNPMGDLVLAPPPLLVAGIVRDAAGAAVVGAAVSVGEPVSQNPSDPDAPVWYWSDLALTREPTTDARGAFEVRMRSAAQRIRVAATLGAERSEPETVDVGSSRVELLLRGTGALAGRLWLDPGIPAGLLHVRAAAIDPAAPDRVPFEWNQTVKPRADGEFVLGDLLAGLVRLEVGVHGRPALVSFPDVLVEAKRERRDPRLDPLDLRGALRHIRLTLVAPEARAGESLEELKGNLAYWAPGTDEKAWTWFSRSPVEVLTPHLAFDGTLSVPGFRTLALHGVDGDRELHLERAIAVRLVLPSGIPLPAPPLYVKATLVPPDGDGMSMDWGGDPFDETREITCLASRPGRMEVCWIVERRVSGGASANTLELETTQYVEITDTPGQRIELEVSADGLRKALEKEGG